MDERDELIAEQQLQIKELTKENEEMSDTLADIHMSLVCIGGPLNDNVLGFDKRQRSFLHEINNQIEPFLRREE